MIDAAVALMRAVGRAMAEDTNGGAATRRHWGIHGALDNIGPTA